MSGTKALRRVRGMQAGIIVFEAGILAFEMLRGHTADAAVPVVCIVAIALAMCWLTRKIRQREYLDRPRPDYAVIARMEREVYGETFQHEGAPDTTVAQLHAAMDDLAERATARRNTCISCGYPRTIASSRCGTCYRRWKSGHSERVAADTTVPATVDQYAAWLRGYIKQGGKPTHFYDYPFSRAGFRYASTRLTIDSGYEFGARSRMIVVASGVETQRTNPAGSFGGWGHTKVFFMHGYRTNDNTVPVYSDPEFDFAKETAS